MNKLEGSLDWNFEFFFSERISGVADFLRNVLVNNEGWLHFKFQFPMVSLEHHRLLDLLMFAKLILNYQIMTNSFSTV